MSNDSASSLNHVYASLLDRFCHSDAPDLLAEADALGREFIAAGIEPLDIKVIHDRAITEVVAAEDTQSLVAAQRLLLEVLFSYGAAYGARAEQLLADADALERAQADDAVEDRLTLLAGVIHELGSPLMVVKMNVGLIRSFLEERGGWPTELDEREGDIAFALERMISLREELLAAIRNEKRELRITAMSAANVLRRAVRWARVAASEKSILVTEELPPHLPDVMADEGALQSILTNLLSNALRYTGAGGSVSLNAHEDKSMIVISVKDSGIGISKEDQLRIYQRFFRANDAKLAAVFGIGIGLAITRELVAALGGTIDVESEPGSGSTFTVCLPAAL